MCYIDSTKKPCVESTFALWSMLNTLTCRIYMNLRTLLMSGQAFSAPTYNSHEKEWITYFLSTMHAPFRTIVINTLESHPSKSHKLSTKTAKSVPSHTIEKLQRPQLFQSSSLEECLMSSQTPCMLAKLRSVHTFMVVLS